MSATDRPAEAPPALDEAMVRRVVDRFYALARRDDVIGPVFRRAVPDAEWQAHLDKITDFWSSVLLGTARYGGRPMPKHLALPELDDRHFMRWLSLFRQTVETLCPPEVAALFIERSETIGNSFRLRIRMHRGEDVLFLKPLEREAAAWTPGSTEADDTVEPIADFDLTRHNTLGLPSRARFGTRITAVGQIPALAEAAARRGMKLHVIGGGSNLVLRETVDAIVAVMAIEGKAILGSEAGQRLVRAAAGEEWAPFVEWTVGEGLGGLENLAAIPGTVGAAPVQNIGAYGLELADRLHSVTAFDIAAEAFVTLSPAECRFAYRHSRFKQQPGRYIITEATFALPQPWQGITRYAGLEGLENADAAAILERVKAVRAAKLPDWRKLGNAGSFFQNPVVSEAAAAGIAGVPRYPQPDGTIKLSAAWLIEACGLKGLRQGPAGVYDRHALILANHGGARYADIRGLADTIRSAVRDRFGIELQQEPVEL